MRGMPKRSMFAVLVGMALVALLALSGVALASGPFAVTKTVPSGGATGIARAANISAYFNHDIRGSTVTSTTFKVRKQNTTTWLGATRSVNNTISPTSTNGGSQSVATLNPNADLAAGTTYQVMVVGGSSGVTDVNGRALGANKSWTFTTAAAPQTTIGSGPVGTVASTSATFTFSSSKAGSTFQCSLDNSTYAGCTSPKSYSSLSEGNHTFRVRAIDASGIADPTPASRTWKVDTASAQPTVVSHAPQSMGGPSTNVTATFSVDMDSSTLTPSTFTLTPQGSSVPLAAQVTYDSASKTASLNPDSDLSDSTSYTAVIKGGAGGAKDLAGNALAQDHSWTFMVCSGGIILSSPDAIAPRVVVCG